VAKRKEQSRAEAVPEVASIQAREPAKKEDGLEL